MPSVPNLQLCSIHNERFSQRSKLSIYDGLLKDGAVEDQNKTLCELNAFAMQKGVIWIMWHLYLQANTPFVYYHLYRLCTDSHNKVWQYL